MRSIKLPGLFTICLLLTTSAFPQFQPKNLIKHYSIKQGLSQGVVNSVVEDNENIIWFATEDGLNRFDGYNFKIFKYDQGAKRGLSDNFIQSLFRDSNDTLWISSRKGLLRFDPDVESFTLYQHDFKDSKIAAPNDVSFITEGSAKNLWIAWYGNGLASFNKKTKTFTPYTLKELPSLSSNQTLTLHEDKFGFLWVGTQSGGLNVFKVINGTITDKIDALSSSVHLPALNVRSIVEDNFNNIWIGTSNGLTVYLRQQNRFYTFNNKNFAIADKSIFSLIADNSENLWIGTQGHGLYQFDLRQFNTRQPEDFIFTRISNLDDFDISKKTMQCFYEDSNKNLWIGTFGDGVYMISSEKEKFAKIQTPLYNESAVSLVSYYGMCYDHDGNIWLGTDGNGLFKKEQFGKNKKHYSADGRPGSIGDNAILSALCDSRGRLWFGTYSNGIFLYNKNTDAFTRYTFKSNDTGRRGGHDVRVIFEDSKKRIWAGTNRGGLCLLDENSKTYRNVDSSPKVLSGGDIRAIVEDASGNLWLGFYGDGLFSYNYERKELKSYFGDSDHKGQLHGQIIYALNFDRQNRLWIGTGGTGIYYYDLSKNKLEGFSEKDGLINNTVYSILIDNNGSCWISTNTGVSKFEPATEKFTNYQSLDGLQEGQFNPGSGLYNALAGYMCFGGTQGLNIFYPEQMDDQLKNPRIMITGLQIFNKPVSIQDSIDGKPVLTQVISRTKDITLNYDQSVITLEFVGLNYSYPEKNNYAYKLEGLDEDWNYVEHQRTATYRYLKPAEYIFKVKASNKENSWGDEYASIAITVKPPLTQTPLAYLCYFVIATTLAILIYRFSRKQLSLRKRLKIEKAQRKQDRRLAMEKLTFFTEISHEFRTPLTLIMGPLEELLSKEPANSPNERKLKMVHRNANKLLLLINKLLDYRKIESGNVILKVKEENLVPFVQEIHLMFKDLAAKKNISFTFHADHEEVNAWFDKEKLEMVVSNILSNAFKYIGDGNEISVSVGVHISDRYPQGRAVIKIKDNGIGISRKHMGNIFEWFYKGSNSNLMSTGIGLSLAKKLIHLHKGEIYVESEEGKGSVFSIKLPMGKEHFGINEVTFVTEEENSTAKELALHEDGEDETGGKKNEKSLLIIEDDEEIRGFLKDYFTQAYKILEASDGSEGLDIAQAHHPDLIISDIMMPGIDGIELCRQLKQNMRTSHIPIILLTAKTSLQHQKEGIETGADAYITKPFSPEILSLTTANLLKSRSNLMRFYRNLFMENSTPHVVDERNAADEKFLHTIYDLLKSNLDKPEFNINELAEVLNMSRSLVYKKVKMLTGLSPVEYIRSLRMQEAAKLLRTQQYKIFEVVYMVGFSDLKYFRKCFAKEFGVSPSDYIRQAEVPNP